MKRVDDTAYRGHTTPVRRRGLSSKDKLEKHNEQESVQPLADDDVQVWYVDNIFREQD